MRLSYLFAGIAVAMSMAGSVLAAPPPGVTGLRAEIQDGSRVILHWDATPGDVSYYRVYYSATSILEHQGEYDDFDQTADSVPEYAPEGILSGENMYVAVMAVNAAGEESEFFTEEVLISDSGASASSISAPASPTQEPESTAPAEIITRSLELLSVEAVSPTEVHLTLSELLQIRSKNAKSAFVIRQTGGEQLETRSVSVEGTRVILSTNEQRPGVVYELRLTDALVEQTGFSIDDANRVSLFTGYGAVEAKAPATSSVPASPPAPETAPAVNSALPVDDSVPNIRGLSLQTTKTLDGRYSVRAEWDPSSVSSQIAFLVIGQSFDDGQTVRNPYLVPANALNATIPGVPAGSFGVFVQAIDVQGRVSPGVFESVMLGMETPTPEGAPAPIAQTSTEIIPPAPYPQQQEVPPPPTTQPASLPRSGAPALLCVFALTGGVLGWKKMRRTKSRA